MVKTVSSMLPLGTLAPHFALKDVVSNQLIKFKTAEPYRASVILFICNHCPYVKHIAHFFSPFAHKYIAQGIRFIAINANDITQYPDDSPENMKQFAQKYDLPFPYVFDETQEVARAYHAACTPDFFVFDQSAALVYRGQFDDSRLGNNIPVTGASLREALDCLIQHKPLLENQKPSLGCNIKWKESISV